MGIVIAWPLANANKPVAAAPDKRDRVPVERDRKSALMNQFVMLRAQQYQVVETCLATSRPMLNVMRIDKALVVAARKRTALVPGYEGAFYRRWHRVSITAEPFDAFDGEV
jgi:hypothetical protein